MRDFRWSIGGEFESRYLFIRHDDLDHFKSIFWGAYCRHRWRWISRQHRCSEIARTRGARDPHPTTRTIRLDMRNRRRTHVCPNAPGRGLPSCGGSGRHRCQHAQPWAVLFRQHGDGASSDRTCEANRSWEIRASRDHLRISKNDACSIPRE